MESYVVFPSAISAELCRDFKAWALKRAPLSEAMIGDEEVDHLMRKSKVSWPLEDDETHPLVTEASRYVAMAQDRLGLLLGGREEWQFTSYSQGEFYNPHMDTFLGEDEGDCGDHVRKLSITVQLSDSDEYEGGNFCFHCADLAPRKQLRKIGTVLAFPSFIVHAVRSVTFGTRYSLVGWMHGPDWR